MRALLVGLLAVLAAPPAAGDDWSEFQQLIKDKDVDKRCQAIDKIKKHKNLQMAQALLPLFADAHPRVRYRAMRAVGACTDEAVVDLLLKSGLKSGDKHARQLACEALGWIKDERAVDPLVGALDDADPNVRAQAADALVWLATKKGASEEKSRKVVDALLAAFGKDKSWEGRAGALDAVGRIDAARAADSVDRAVADKAYQVRMVGMEVAAKVSKDAGTKAMRSLVADADWRVRLAAAEAAPEIRSRESVGLLVQQFEKEKGRLRWDFYVALVDVSGRDLGLDPKPWKTWWEANKDSFEPPPRPEKGAGGQLMPGGGGTRAEFFKIPILSNRLSFVLDLSGSMRDDAPEGGTKLDVAKKGMVKTIESFTSDVHFNVINLGCFPDGTYKKDQKVWKKKLTEASAPNRADAVKFVNRQEAKGWTNIWDGIEYAFEDPEVDTVFLYSDGGASKGVWTATWEILTHLDRMNRFRKIMIFTVETPSTKANTEDNIELLKQLAQHTKGAYRLAETK